MEELELLFGSKIQDSFDDTDDSYRRRQKVKLELFSVFRVAYLYFLLW